MNTVCLCLALIVAAASAYDGVGCKTITLSSKSYAYNRVTVQDAARVTSMTRVNKLSHSDCISGESFGFYGTDVWVNLGCRAKFEVCTVPGESKEIACASNQYKPNDCDAPGIIESVAIKSHTSQVPCVEGFSFFYAGSKLYVTNGCRATFVVGYQA